MKPSFRLRSVTSSLLSLFGAKKPLSTYQRHPYEYYKQTWIARNIYEGIDFFALGEKKSIKAETQELLEIGLR